MTTTLYLHKGEGRFVDVQKDCSDYFSKQTKQNHYQLYDPNQDLSPSLASPYQQNEGNGLDYF